MAVFGASHCEKYNKWMLDIAKPGPLAVIFMDSWEYNFTLSESMELPQRREVITELTLIIQY